jgi:parvulin-like peptidyl-prolyl cis-trans isomerase-like protein
LRRLLREPLLQFLALGLALFAAYRLFGGDGEGGQTIVIDEPRVALIREQFRATWSRDPTPAELHGLVDTAIRDEMLYREGDSLGLGRDDPVVMRRIRQKYEVLAEELIEDAPPTDAALEQWLATHATAYARPAVVTFSQILLAAGEQKVDTGRAADAARRSLAGGADPASLGMRTLLPPHEETVGLDRVARDYGDSFADTLRTAPVGEWRGPVESGYGAHLVRVEARIEGRTPSLDEIRPQVMRDWEAARRDRALDAKLAELRRKYDIVVTAALPAPGPP